jgi:single-strand DNA-binding protein
MNGLNRVMLLGNLGADPELRMTAGGQAVLKLRLATTESYLDRDKARQERTEWHNVVVWGKRAEGLGKIVRKGDRIFIEGGLRTSSYEKDGEKRYRTEVIASDVILNGKAVEAKPAKSADAEPPMGPGAGDFDDDDILF